MAEINVTPLVDVMLVLLIIFMVAAPMMHRGIDLELPAAKTAASRAEDRVIISITREGLLYIDDRPVHEALFAEKVESLLAGRGEEGVFLRADGALPYARVLGVMDTLRAHGIEKITLVTTAAPPEPAGARN